MRLTRIANNLGAIVLAIPSSYATIMFSDSTLLGLMLLAITFLSPILGLSGLLGLFTALLLSRIAGFESWDSKSGVIAFNSLTVSLAVAYYFPTVLIYSNPIYFAAFIITASVFTMFLYLVLNYFSMMWLRLPSMSLAFSISALMIWYYFAKIGYLSNYDIEKPLLLSRDLAIPAFWKMYFVSLGSIFFVPTVIGGIIISIALFVSTRIGVFFSLLGWTLCFYMLQFMGINSSNGMFYPGFNIIIIFIAVGSIFLLPSKSSILLASISAVFGFMLTILMSKVFHYYNPFTLHYTPLAIPVFAFPLNIVVLLVVFTLRLRIVTTKPSINDMGVYNPERSLEIYQERFRRFFPEGIPQFCLPISGEWLITQGHNGSETHKYDWSYAWDFEIEDTSGKRYSENELQLTDYYAYNKPVVASAAGYVVRVVDSVSDNPIGGVNTQNNWGNYVSISHGYGLYSLYAHLKSGSIPIKEGDYIAKGSRIGSVGNSGRSPLPHLHFQVQLGIEAGTKTVLSHLINFKKLSNDRTQIFISSGIPELGDKISPLVPEEKLQTYMGLDLIQESKFAVNARGKTYNENWKCELDFKGTQSIVSSRGCRLDFSFYNGIYNALGFTNRKDSALFAFAILLSRLPYAEKQHLQWNDEPALSISFGYVFKALILLFMPLINPFRTGIRSDFSDEGKLIKITSLIRYRFMGIVFRELNGTVTINKSIGIEEIRLNIKGKEILHAKRNT